MPLSRNNCDEVWYTGGPVDLSQQGDIKIRTSPDYLALHIEQKVSAKTLCQATQSAYQRLVSIARNCGYEPMQRACFRVCLRQPETLKLLMKELSGQWVPTGNIVFLSGDRCCKELMVEIEGNQWI